ncbi:MAG: acetolactate synthase small subunit, partial [Candidatus Margulisiibacteriota bacterium]
EITKIVDIFRARIVDLGEDAVIIEATGDSEKIDALENMLTKYGIKEMVRTGKIALSRSEEIK